MRTSFILAPLFAALVSALPVLAQTPDTAKSAAAKYPLSTCIVSDEPLGDEPVDYIHKEAGKPDRLVRFCCDGCIDDFKAEPAKYLPKLDATAKAKPETKSAVSSASEASSAALAEQKANYPLKVCAVSGEALGSMGEPFEHVHQQAGEPDRLVRMCCKGCLKTFKKDPVKYIARIDAAAKAKPSASPTP